MSQAVSKSSLYALARLAIAGILNEDKPEVNLGNGADDDPLFNLLKAERRYDEIESEAERADWLKFAGGLTGGFDLGLAVAAAIFTHGLDSNAAKGAVKAELDSTAFLRLPEEVSNAA